MGGGGPAKAADPKVTPFVDPVGPKNPIPNWFAGSANTGGNTGAGTFTPDFTQSQQAFGQPVQQAQQQFMPQQQVMPSPGHAAPPMGQDYMGEQRFMPFGIPTQMRFGPHGRPGPYPNPDHAPHYANYTDTGSVAMGPQNNLWGIPPYNGRPR